MRGLTRPEPYYEAGRLAEAEAQANHTVQYDYTAREAQSDFAPARADLIRLGRIRQEPLARQELGIETFCRTQSAPPAAYEASGLNSQSSLST